MDYYKLKVLNNKKKIFMILFVLLIIGCGCYYFFVYQEKNEIIIKKEETIVEIEEKQESEEKNNYIYVDIKGYVAKPGVYSFKEDDNARVNDLIIKAGGLKKEADTSVVNLSKKLEDEMTIVIYSKSEIEKSLNGDNELKKKLELCEAKIQNNACIKEENVVNNNLININKASKEELMTLSGIGENKALAIIEFRKQNSFKNIEEIKNVEGIGEALFESIKGHITI